MSVERATQADLSPSELIYCSNANALWQVEDRAPRWIWVDLWVRYRTGIIHKPTGAEVWQSFGLKELQEDIHEYRWKNNSMHSIWWIYKEELPRSCRNAVIMFVTVSFSQELFIAYIVEESSIMVHLSIIFVSGVSTKIICFYFHKYYLYKYIF